MQEKSNSSRAGLILRTLNEYNVRNICGEMIYGAGLQDYLHERVSQMEFSKNSLFGKLRRNGILSAGPKQQSYFEASVTLESNSKKTRYRTYGDCTCTLSMEEGSLCSHIAALMVAWARKPQDFEENVKSDFERARRLAIDSLEKLVSSIEESSSGFKDDLEMLQKTYTKLRHWASEIGDATNQSNILITSSKNSRLAIREFSSMINYMSFVIIFAIENKYNTGASTQLYNKTTVSTFGKVLEAFVQSPRLGKSIITPTIEKSSNKKRQSAIIKSKSIQSQTTRSWDKLVEDFADRQVVLEL